VGIQRGENKRTSPHPSCKRGEAAISQPERTRGKEKKRKATDDPKKNESSRKKDRGLFRRFKETLLTDGETGAGKVKLSSFPIDFGRALSFAEEKHIGGGGDLRISEGWQPKGKKREWRRQSD